jgi:hypothetical protein
MTTTTTTTTTNNNNNNNFHVAQSKKETPTKAEIFPKINALQEIAQE